MCLRIRATMAAWRSGAYGSVPLELKFLEIRVGPEVERLATAQFESNGAWRGTGHPVHISRRRIPADSRRLVVHPLWELTRVTHAFQCPAQATQHLVLFSHESPEPFLCALVLCGPADQISDLARGIEEFPVGAIFQVLGHQPDGLSDGRIGTSLRIEAAAQQRKEGHERRNQAGDGEHISVAQGDPGTAVRIRWGKNIPRKAAAPNRIEHIVGAAIEQARIITERNQMNALCEGIGQKPVEVHPPCRAPGSKNALQPFIQQDVVDFADALRASYPVGCTKNPARRNRKDDGRSRVERPLS